MNTTYRTIIAQAEGIFKDRGSKFLAYAYPFQQKDELKPVLTQLKKEHSKAVHFCYAYRLGTEGTDFRANDDGEPGGSAGRLILGQIDSFGLTHILVVVVRYFGGTLLGVPGLIHAYKTATLEALRQTEMIEKDIEKELTIEFDYPFLGEVMSAVKSFDARIGNQDMGLFCRIVLSVPLARFSGLKKRMEGIYGVKVEE